MGAPDDRLPARCARWRLDDPEAVTTTRLATLYRARRDERPVALMLFHPGRGQSEALAPALFTAFAGTRAVARLFAATPEALLLGWIDCAPLGQLARDGRAAEADATLARAPWPRCTPARCIHLPAPFPDLRRHTRALHRFDLALLETPLTSDPGIAPRLLHGDLHHDNVIGCPGHWIVVDPKGVFGDAHFEPANGFRNPPGCHAWVHDPTRPRRLAETMAAAVGLDVPRLLAWAAVEAALSLTWRFEGTAPPERLPADDMALLTGLLDIALAAGGPRA